MSVHLRLKSFIIPISTNVDQNTRARPKRPVLEEEMLGTVSTCHLSSNSI